MSQVQHSIEATVSAAASKATGAGSAVTVVGWLTSSNFGMWAGIVIGVAGLIVNAYFKRKELHIKHAADVRAKEAHAAFMRKMSFTNEMVEPMEADE